MLILITYDVSTVEKAGQRVQKSVFECQVGQKEWATLRHRLLSGPSNKKNRRRLICRSVLRRGARIEQRKVRQSLRSGVAFLARGSSL